MDEEIVRTFTAHAGDLLQSERVLSMQNYIQHGEVNCLQHCVGVAIFSLLFVRALRIRCDERALIRGALLHDYFLYDWHEKEAWHRLHGFSHARTALKNASTDFDLCPVEKDIIRKHMWPLNFALPRYKESWIVNFIDTYCSSLETVGKIPAFRFLQNKIVNIRLIPTN